MQLDLKDARLQSPNPITAFCYQNMHSKTDLRHSEMFYHGVLPPCFLYSLCTHVLSSLETAWRMLRKGMVAVLLAHVGGICDS